MIVTLILVCIVQYYLLVRAKRIRKRILRKKKYITDDSNSFPIYQDSFVQYRGKICKVKWDDALLSYFITPVEKNEVVTAIPFTSYTAKECEVCGNVMKY